MLVETALGADLPTLQPYGAVTEAVTETYSVARVSVDTSVTEPLRRPYGAATEPLRRRNGTPTAP